ncbi:MAG: PEP-CTERM sorting domain-containing protein [Phycisphaerales bacterium]|nr:MAG: PEP-CTERM sorting domain-containing protein [Phycisphaerales bacterium]
MSRRVIVLMSLALGVFLVCPAGAALVIGDWENDMDGWILQTENPGNEAGYSTVGVTLNDNSLRMSAPGGGWAKALQIKFQDLGLVDEFLANDTFSIDVTRLVNEWTGAPADGHSGVHLYVNAGGDGWNLWEDKGYQGWWKYDQGDKTQTVSWDYSASAAKIDAGNLWWCELFIATNYDAAYATGGVYYFDNAQLIPEPATLALLGLGGLALLRRRK